MSYLVSRPALSIIPVILAFCASSAGAATTATSDLNLGLSCASGTPMWMSTQIPAPVTGVIVQILSRTAALQRITTTERNSGARIDPAYFNNERVIVRFRPGKGIGVLVPIGMSVHIGDVVTFIPAHADPNNLCSYIPNLITPAAPPSLP